MIKDDDRPGRELSPADMTRAALLHAALKLFGRQGFDGTSTREIAAAAKANIGSIAYHFGGKEGLRLAAADHIAETIRAIAGPALKSAPLRDGEGLTPEAASALLKAMIERMVGFIVGNPQSGDIVQFVLRELSQPTEALDRIYDGFFEPMHKRLCQLWQQATGESAEDEATKLTVFTLIGQVVYFRIGREAVTRRMGWSEIGPSEAAKVTAAIGNNLDALLNARKGQKP